MSITKEILKAKENKASLSIEKKIFAISASIFSVLFSLSIVLELAKMVSGIVLTFLIVFTVLFLVANESIKVQQVQKFFKGNKNALLSGTMTFVISLSLSGIGVWFWTNKTDQITSELKSNIATKELSIENKYFDLINNESSKKFEDTKEYTNLMNDLSYWKKKSAGSLEERTEIREYIRTLESKISDARIAFNKQLQANIALLNDRKASELSLIDTDVNNTLSNIDRNSFISIIFFIMILFSEIGIVVMNKEIASHNVQIDDFIKNDSLVDEYLLARDVLKSLYVTHRKNSVSIYNVMQSPALSNVQVDFDKIKYLYNLYINLDILDKGRKKKAGQKSIVVNQLKTDLENALVNFDEYYDNVLSFQTK